MAHAIPPGFSDLTSARDAPDHSFQNIIGIVVDLLSPTLTRKGDHMLTFRLLDLRLADSLGGREGLMVRFFVKDEEQLPKVRNIGDAVLLRKVKTMTIAGQRLALSHYTTQTIVIPSASIPSPAFSIGYHDKNRIEALGTPLALQNFSLIEQQYIINLRHSAGMVSIIADRFARMSASAPTATAVASLPVQRVKQKYVEQPGSAVQPPAKKAKQDGGFGFKFKLVEGLQPRMYADVCGEVVKMYTAAFGCDLYITDYTSNEQMRYYPKPEEETEQERDGDTFGYSGPPRREWPGPYEWLVLKINLKHPHAKWALETGVKEGDCVLLKNIKVDISKVGTWLEGTLWEDFNYPERIQISKVTNPALPEIQALRQRKEKYWTSRNAHAQQTERGMAESKSKTKKEMKRERQKKEKAAKLAKEAEEAAELAKKDVNRSVRCTHEDIPITKVADILDPQNKKHTNSTPDGGEYVMPFINAKYRAKVRVVDHEPKNLEDFAVRAEPGHEESDDPDRMYLEHSSPSYEWYFSLLLEDASIPKPANETERQRIWVQVHHENAQFLLGSLEDPDDLRQNEELLGRLSEKLFLLWGNLYEAGGDRLDNKPFECIIMEYGIPVDDDDEDSQEEAVLQGYKRMYAMAGASIL